MENANVKEVEEGVQQMVFYVPKGIHKQFKLLSVNHDVPMNQIMIRLMQEYISDSNGLSASKSKRKVE